MATVLPQYSPNVPLNTARVLIEWYPQWVDQQMKQMPPELFSVLSLKSPSQVPQTFLAVWKESSNFLSDHVDPSIDLLVEHLQTKDLIAGNINNEERHRARCMVFSVIGWQTMLFRADYGSCPPSKLGIAEETGAHRGQAHMTLHCEDSRSCYPLHECLLGFGVLLPPPNCDLEELKEHKRAFAEVRFVSASNLNAALLINVARWKIKWTDCLACHLELVLSKSLYLFRYPSFCVANRVVQKVNGTSQHGTLHACAQSSPGRATWAPHDDVSQMLEEVLMSYRLLFGQNKRSRKLFRSLTPFSDVPAKGKDALLAQLCGRKAHSEWLQRPERESYDMKHDFPILRSRLAKITYELALRKPQTWKELWQDRRDSGQWATFWVILIVGGLGLLFAFVQIVLQILQITLNK